MATWIKSKIPRRWRHPHWRAYYGISALCGRWRDAYLSTYISLDWYPERDGLRPDSVLASPILVAILEFARDPSGWRRRAWWWIENYEHQIGGGE
jgi:hypothetical protein